MNDLTGIDGLDGFEQLRTNRLKILDVVVRHGDDDNAQLQFSDILLVLEILVNGNKHIKSLFRQPNPSISQF